MPHLEISRAAGWPSPDVIEVGEGSAEIHSSTNFQNLTNEEEGEFDLVPHL